MYLAIVRVDRAFSLAFLSLTMAVIASAMADPIGDRTDILQAQVEGLNEYHVDGTFELDSEAVRVATRNALGPIDTFFDASPPPIELKQRVQKGTQKTKWHDLFSASVDDTERVRPPSTEEFKLLPLEGSFGELAYGNGQLVSSASLDNEHRTTNLFHNAPTADESRDHDPLVDVVVRPEPSGWTIMTTLLVSVAVLGCCTRLFRQRRD